MNAGVLLTQAEQILHGTAPNRNRMACWLARSALEEIVRSRLIGLGRPTGASSMRSALTCLEVATADQPSLVQRAEYAWSGLSSSCHYHAYELTPTAAEAERLIGVVRGLVTGAP